MSSSSFFRTYSKYLAYKSLALSIIVAIVYFSSKSCGTVKNIDLSKENINGIYLFDKADVILLGSRLGNFSKEYSSGTQKILEFSRDNSEAKVQINQNNEITSITVTSASDSFYKTEKNINFQSTLSDVTYTYGRKFRRENNLSGSPEGYSITYNDNSNKIVLKFYLINESGKERITTVSLISN